MTKTKNGPPRAKAALRRIVSDVKHLPPLLLLAVAEIIKYRHMFAPARTLGKLALDRVQDQDDTMKGLALLSVGHAYFGVNDYMQAENYLRQAKGVLEVILPGPFQRFYLMRSLLLLADVLVNLGRHAEAEDLGREADTLIKQCREAPSSGDASSSDSRSLLDRLARRTSRWRDFCLRSMIELGELYYYTSCWADGERLLRELVPTLVSEKGVRHPQTIEAQRDLASMLVNQDKYAEAEAAYRLARDWHERSPTFGREEQGAIDYNIAMCLSEQGKSREAMRELERLNISDDLFFYANGDWTLKLARATHLELEQWDEVVVLARRFADVLDSRFGDDSEVALKNLADLVMALNRLQRYDEAVTVLRDMRVREMKATDCLETRRQLARSLRLSGHLDESAFEWRKLLEKLQSWTDEIEDQPELELECLENLVCLYEHAQHRENVVITYTKLHNAYANAPKSEPCIMKYLCFRGKLFLFNGQPGTACSLFRRALTVVQTRKSIIMSKATAEAAGRSEVLLVEDAATDDSSDGPERLTQPLLELNKAILGKSHVVCKFTRRPGNQAAPDPSSEVTDPEVTGTTGWDALVWWEAVIQAAIRSAENGHEFQVPAPVPPGDLTWHWAIEDNANLKDESVGRYMSTWGGFPYAPRDDEWQARDFEALPDKFGETKRRKEDVEWEEYLAGL